MTSASSFMRLYRSPAHTLTARLSGFGGISPSAFIDAANAGTLDGFHLHRLPGHTPALMGLQIELANAGPFLLTSDQFHLRENYEGPQPLGAPEPPRSGNGQGRGAAAPPRSATAGRAPGRDDASGD